MIILGDKIHDFIGNIWRDSQQLQQYLIIILGFTDFP
jgi:hypothetical protein